MKEIAQILDLWSALSAAGEEAVLATVVKTQGSSYRLPGARLLLTKQGQRVGSVSGGCLEDDIVKKAWWLTENGPILRRYDTTPENEISTSGYGLGCNGVIYIRLERVGPDSSILKLIKEVRAERRAATVTHPISDEEVFVETLTPAVRLLVFGAGDDAIPVTELAKQMGWDVMVFDGRSHYARREKFPSADAVIVRPEGGPIPAVDPWTAAVLMSHSYSQDLAALRDLANQPIPYLGILGPNKRTVQLFADAHLDPAKIAAKAHGPMGLDIGADGPEQVALAVISEIQACLNGREGGALHTRQGSIHAREADAGAFVRSIVCA